MSTNKPKEKEFTLPEWEKIWTELNKLVEDIPAEEVEARWDGLISEGYALASKLHELADNIEGSLEMAEAEREHHKDMFSSILDDEDKPVIECNACGYPVYSSGCPACHPDDYER